MSCTLSLHALRHCCCFPVIHGLFQGVDLQLSSCFCAFITLLNCVLELNLLYFQYHLHSWASFAESGMRRHQMRKHFLFPAGVRLCIGEAALLNDPEYVELDALSPAVATEVVVYEAHLECK